MGQGISQPQRLGREDAHTRVDSPQRRRRYSIATLLDNLHSVGHQEESHEDAGVLLSPQLAHDVSEARSSNRNRLSRLLRSSSDSHTVPSSPSRSALQRSRSTFSSMFRRIPSDHNSERASRPHGAYHQHRNSYLRTADELIEEHSFHPPRLPSIDQSSTFDRDLFWHPRADSPPRSSQSHRRSNIRFNALRPDRPFRHLTSSLRRRRASPPAAPRRPGGAEDQAVLLSQLLSAAAAATAATLMGDDHQALNEARSLSLGNSFGDVTGAEDGSFAGFLRALSSGRFASALRQNGDNMDEIPGAQNNPLNFFRMFRFGSSAMPATGMGASAEPAEAAANNPHATGEPSTDGAPPADSRMVPIIIVGIRSISPSTTSAAGSTEDLPPFLDALTNFTSPSNDTDDLDPLGHSSIDSILRPPQNGTSFRHRRRASMGGFGMGRSRIHDRYDDQRDHRAPERRRERPWSMASSVSNEPRPPPATPSSPSPELSRLPSSSSTPVQSRPTSLVANSIRDLIGNTSRSSLLHRSTSSPLASHTEENMSVRSLPTSNPVSRQSPEVESVPVWSRRNDTSANVHYPRFASGHPRRNGVVEPDHLPPLSRQSTNAGTATATEGTGNRSNDSRSWIIYVLGGSYPENHPILTTPSLFSDNPTYEDMMLLSALLGPAKAPVATDEDVQNAGGIYVVTLPLVNAGAGHEQMDNNATSTGLVAIASEDTDVEHNPAAIALEASHRCLVCLGDFEVEEMLRRLGKCGHLYHKECIDHWLTQGRNSCPLCRGEGVEEKTRSASTTADPSMPIPT